MEVDNCKPLHEDSSLPNPFPAKANLTTERGGGGYPQNDPLNSQGIVGMSHRTNCGTCCSSWPMRFPTPAGLTEGSESVPTKLCPRSACAEADTSARTWTSRAADKVLGATKAACIMADKVGESAECFGPAKWLRQG